MNKGGLANHIRTHAGPTLPENAKKYTRRYHRHLNGMSATLFSDSMHAHTELARPCDKNGTFLDDPATTKPLPYPAHTIDPENPWAPFEDRIAYDFAQYHYVEVQSSADEISRNLDMLVANSMKHSHNREASGPNGWRNTKDMYTTIDSIPVGDVPWKTYKFRYTGPKPSTPPQWMLNDYELSVRDIVSVLEQQLSTSEFDGQIDYVPYEEYDPQGDRVWSNLLSGLWAGREAVSPLSIDSTGLLHTILTCKFRIPLLRIIPKLVGPCSYLSLQGVIKRRSLWPLAIRNTILCMRQLAILQIRHVVVMEMALLHSHFSRSLKVG